jgi:selenocysteine lyase/cysteine desulfurase
MKSVLEKIKKLNIRNLETCKYMNIKELRSETKGCLTTIHFNNAGASLMPDVVLDAIKGHFDLESSIGGYEAAALRANEIEKTYHSVAKLLNTESKNIALVSNATDAYNKALSSIVFQAGDVVLTTSTDYSSNHIAFMSLQKRFGIFVTIVKNSENGQVDVAEFENVIKKTNPKLVAVTHVPTNTGLVQPVEEIGTLCQKYDILYLVDVCQSVGQLNVDVQKIKCDFASATCRKFLRGPRGAGFLYVSDKALAMNLEPLFLDMCGANWTGEKSYQTLPSARRYEYWESACALTLGMGVATDYLLEIGIENIEKRNTELRKYFIAQLHTLDGLRILDKGENLSNIITVDFEKMPNLFVKQALYKNKINTTISGLTAGLLDFKEKEVQDALRFSPHYYNTTEEIDIMIDVLKKM